MKVRDKMTKNVEYVKPTNTVVEAAQVMQKLNVGSVPVFDQNKVVGMVTDRDIVVRNVAHGKSPQDTKVQDVMTSQVTTVTPDMEVEEVSKIMAQQQIRRVPVVENNQLVGILSLGDIATDYRFDTEASEALSEISKTKK
ncbi:CBS domain-containing protein [Acetivibrio clariflavus]|uniref:Putative signal-transduction protein containing cAMP-binding and CBS domains n=1 Tax=Acetivibrio clariflavus (strain DSM 19732 / NBRC 101661 / EBR45) TaxID=720554 RepID=G8LUI6_ACECE|nr:CBS domain-containing protein [Acetivibrio clariflavus]AEV70634.1 putative signal-transduction protein containing cAMP-binding and CBS domains [Acetivibrio clariflavus DSM 19732]